MSPNAASRYGWFSSRGRSRDIKVEVNVSLARDAGLTLLVNNIEVVDFDGHGQIACR